MCTVSVLPDPGGYRLWMNRDERFERRDGDDVVRQGGAQWPREAHSGGTWIGVHADGLTLALLNQYPEGFGGSGARSRGGLIPAVLGAASASAALEAAAAEREGRAPFLLLAFERGAGPWRALRWDGHRVRFKAWQRRPLAWTSSSVGGLGVLLARRRRLRAVLTLARAGGPEAAGAFERAHASHGGPGAICVHRATSGTVALDRVTVTAEAVHLEHRSGPACGAGA